MADRAPNPAHRYAGALYRIGWLHGSGTYRGPALDRAEADCQAAAEDLAEALATCPAGEVLATSPQRSQSLPPLSREAAALLDRIVAGRFYPVDSPRTPWAMRELLAKGYVITAPRIKVLVSCYVPAGTLPAIPERMPQQVAVPQRGKAAL